MIDTDILIVGAGPTGLFTVFEAGLLKLRCHLIDALPMPGGQCAEIYPKKPIYDIPAYPEILAGDLVDQLLAQIAPFQPGYTLGERADALEQLEDGRYQITTDKGTVHRAPVVIIAGGLGSFEPRKPPIEGLSKYEDRGVHYAIREPEDFRNKRVVIAGGGDSALDWTVFLAEVASQVNLVHRRQQFRGAADTLEKVRDLAASDRIQLLTDAEITEVHGGVHLEALTVKRKHADPLTLQTDHFIPLFGLTPKLGPIADWGLDLEKNAIRVDNALDYGTGRPGIFAVGDVNTYPGKLKLILSGFHEAAIACQAAYAHIYPGKRNVLKYTTVNGVEGFDGSKKEAKREEVAALG